MKTTKYQHTICSPTKKPVLFISTILLLILGAVSISIAKEEEKLADLVQIALENNSDILSARSRLVESTEKIRQAGVLPDPKLGVEYFLQPVETRTGPQEASISLNQSIPWPGRLTLDKQLKENETEIAKAFFGQHQS